MVSKVLITSVGSMVAQNILETLKYRRENLFLIGTDANADAPLYDCDKVYLVPETKLPPSEFSKSISDIIKTEDPDIIIPGRDIDVIVLAELRSQFPGMEKRFVCGGSEVARLVEDKWLSFEFTQKEGLPFADSLIFDDAENNEAINNFIDKHDFPLILKPRKGFASRSITVITNKDQLLNHSKGDEMILQEYLGDPKMVMDAYSDFQENGLPLFYSLEEIKYSLQLFIDHKGALKDSLVTLHKMKSGVSGTVDLFEDHGMSEIIDKYFKVFSRHGWYGPLNVQFQRSHSTQEFKAYEINGRFTGATAARFILGYDEVGFAMEEAGIKLPQIDPRFNSQKRALKQTYISERPQHHVKALNAKGVWHKSDL